MNLEAVPPDFWPNLQALQDRAGTERTVAFTAGGRRFWLKRVEQHRNWMRRLLKGDPQRALARETASLRRLAAEGVPVPPVLAEGANFLVMGDAGPTLEDLLVAPERDRAGTVAAFRAAGQALARLHRQGLGHGRAMPKDFCWDGAAISFIDFETDPGRFDLLRDGGREIVYFLFRTYYMAIRQGRDLSPEVAGFAAGYREAGDPVALAGARRWARRRWWLIPLVAPFAWLKPPRKAADLKAVAPALIYAAQFLEG